MLSTCCSTGKFELTCRNLRCPSSRGQLGIQGRYEASEAAKIVKNFMNVGIHVALRNGDYYCSVSLIGFLLE